MAMMPRKDLARTENNSGLALPEGLSRGNGAGRRKALGQPMIGIIRSVRRRRETAPTQDPARA